jgi:signal transduction histidine kinase
MSVASHELRTPLTSLSLYVDRLLGRKPEDLENLPPERLRLTLTRARSQVYRLNGLVESLLDVSRIKAGRLQLEPEEMDLVELAREIVARFTEQLPADGEFITLQAPEAIVGRWDRARLEQVLTNLLDNALKYGRNAPVTVELETEGAMAVLRVKDTGIGISPEKIERIFDRFERATTQRMYGGLGLGLYIARQIVEAHAGTIRVHSTLGVGSEFVVELPLAIEAEAAAPAARREITPPPSQPVAG